MATSSATSWREGEKAERQSEPQRHRGHREGRRVSRKDAKTAEKKAEVGGPDLEWVAGHRFPCLFSIWNDKEINQSGAEHRTPNLFSVLVFSVSSVSLWFRLPFCLPGRAVWSRSSAWVRCCG